MASPRTRELILEHLATHPTASTGEMARALDVGAADIRYHVATLLDEHILEIVPQPAEPSGRRGRPSRRLRLAAEQQPNNYQHLAHALLTLVENLSSEGGPDIPEALAAQMSAGQPMPGSLARRLAGAIDLLNRQHYNASWEAHKPGPRILFHHCPYAALWREHPLLCEVDTHLLARLLALPVERIETIQSKPGRHLACVFQVISAGPAGAPQKEPSD